MTTVTKAFPHDGSSRTLTTTCRNEPSHLLNSRYAARLLSDTLCFSSISSTLMDMESTASSGRSTPAMLSSHDGGVTAAASTVSGGKSLNYTCFWDECQLVFSSSPDLAEHIRASHVDRQREGVSASLKYACICWSELDHQNLKPAVCISNVHMSKTYDHKTNNSGCRVFVCLLRCLCVCGRAVRCTTLRPPVRAGSRGTC